MSFNMKINDDFYDMNQQQKKNPYSPIGGMGGLDFVNDVNNTTGGQFYDPAAANFYQPQQHQQKQQMSSMNNNINTNSFYSNSDWSQQQDQFYNPSQFMQQPQDRNDPFSQPYGSYAKSTAGSAQEFENEPPLLEELGINFDHIFKKTKSVLNPFSKPHESIIHDEDLAGPLVFCIAYGFSLLLMGKVQFGFIYGVTALGCVCMYSLLNLMLEKGISAVCVGSTLGYCLLPMVILSFISLILPLQGLLGLFISLIFILWCSLSASNLFVSAHNMANQQILVLYPCFLLYGIFALLNAF